MKTLVLGMGNPILGDDGIGIAVAKALEGKVSGADVAVSAMIGLDLLDLMAGYERVFLVDAMCTKGGDPGEVRKIAPQAGPGTMHLFNSHGLHFFEILEMGRRCGMDVPEVGAVYGIEIGDAICFDENLSTVLQERFELIVETVMKDMGMPGVHRSDSPGFQEELTSSTRMKKD